MFRAAQRAKAAASADCSNENVLRVDRDISGGDDLRFSSISVPEARQASVSTAATAQASSARTVLNRYCVGCHNERMKANYAGLALDSADTSSIAGRPEVWEKVVRKLRAGLMPPAGRPRPDTSAQDQLVDVAGDRARSRRRGGPESGPHRAVPSPESRRVPQRHPRPAGDRDRRRVAAADRRCELRLRQHRGRAEDQSVADGAVPRGGAEDQPDGARRVPVPAPAAQEFRVPETLPQYEHIDGLPFGTRGGMLVRYDVSAERRVRDRRRSAVPDPGRMRRQRRFPDDAPAGSDRRRRAGEAVHAGAAQRIPTSRGTDVARACPGRGRSARGGGRVPEAAVVPGSGCADGAVPAAELSDRRRGRAIADDLSALRRSGDDHGPLADLAPGRRARACRDAEPQGDSCRAARRTVADEGPCARKILRRWPAGPIAGPSPTRISQPLLEFYREGAARETFEAGIEAALRGCS